MPRYKRNHDENENEGGRNKSWRSSRQQNNIPAGPRNDIFSSKNITRRRIQWDSDSNDNLGGSNFSQLNDFQRSKRRRTRNDNWSNNDRYRDNGTIRDDNDVSNLIKKLNFGGPRKFKHRENFDGCKCDREACQLRLLEKTTSSTAKLPFALNFDSPPLHFPPLGTHDIFIPEPIRDYEGDIEMPDVSPEYPPQDAATAFPNGVGLVEIGQLQQQARIQQAMIQELRARLEAELVYRRTLEEGQARILGLGGNPGWFGIMQ